ncbi:odorant receptor 131-2-like [Pelobates fuscus]|uniref:odorant receptor 131-2-like n=1 Tax=Pelobates fuscus TaxID=191477 RepID=UPI002FE4608C
MLIVDTIFVSLCIFLLLSALFVPLYIPVPICYIIVNVLAASFKVTPYNLAVMSLERYVVICFPLRHMEACTRHNSLVAVAVIWIIGFLPNITDFFIMVQNENTNFYLLSVKCSQRIFLKTEEKQIINAVADISSFVLVGLIVIFTYIQIMLIAVNIESKNSSASKAGKTILLHAFQLLLCMSAFVHNFIEMHSKEYIQIATKFSFLFLMCLPRTLSPLIYGFRDELLRNYIKKFVFCLKVSPNTT